MGSEIRLGLSATKRHCFPQSPLLIAARGATRGFAVAGVVACSCALLRVEPFFIAIAIVQQPLDPRTEWYSSSLDPRHSEQQKHERRLRKPQCCRIGAGGEQRRRRRCGPSSPC